MLEELLKRGVDPNEKNEFIDINDRYKCNFTYDYPTFYYVVGEGHIDAVNLFLQYGANVNWCDGEHYSAYSYMHSPLSLAINNRHFTIVKILCNAGASLVCHKLKGPYKNSCMDFNAFNSVLESHEYLAKELDMRSTEEYVKMLITYARFDEKRICNKTISRKNKKQKCRAIKTALLVFNRLANEKKIPYLLNDIKFLILNKLPPKYWHSVVISKETPNNVRQLYLFTQVQRRVKGLQYILRHCNKKVINEYTNNVRYKSKIEKLKPLLDGTRLKNDYSKFEDAFPNNLDSLLEDNLAFEMYKNCSRLAIEQ